MKTLLKVLSVLLIISGILSIVLGIVAIVGGGGVAVLGLNAMDTTNATLSSEDGAVAAGLGVMFIVVGIVALISAVFTLITGIFGWKGANGNEGKLKAALVMGWISLGLSILSLIMTLVEKSGNTASQVVGMIIPALFVIAATYAKTNHSLEG